MDALTKFNSWNEYHETHLTRHLELMRKQVMNLREYVELFHTLPANSLEFKVEVEKLFNQARSICEEMHESYGDLKNDFEGFKDVLESFENEVVEKLSDE